MARRNLEGSYGESRVVSIRLSNQDLGAVEKLQEAWGGSFSECLRRALRESADNLVRERNPEELE